MARNSDRIVVTGAVPSVVPYLRNVALAVVPLRYESGTRFKILEAFACRTPVVSTSLGAEGLRVENGKHLIIADTPDKFAEAMLQLRADAGLRSRLTDEAYALVHQEYDLPAAERQIKAILKTLSDENA